MKIYNIDELDNSRLFFDMNTPKFMSYVIYIVLLCIFLVVVWTVFAIKYNVIKTTGTIENTNKHYVTVEYEGVVKKIHFEEGDFVNQGDVIIELDSKHLDLEREKINHEITRLEEELYNHLIFKDSVIKLSNMFNKASNEFFYNKVNLFLDEYENIEHSKEHSYEKIEDTEKVKRKITVELDECNESIEKNNSNLNENELLIKALKEEIILSNNLLVEKEVLLANETEELIKEQYTNEIVQLNQILISLQNSLKESLSLNQQYESLKISLKNRKLQLENQKENVVDALEDFDESIKHVDTQMEMFVKKKIIEIEKELERLEHEIIDLNFNNEKIDITRNSILIRANYSGKIHFSEEVIVGQMLNKGKSFAEVINTSDDLVYVTYVTSIDKIMIVEDLDVTISLPGEFKNKYGNINGKITKISVKPLKQNGTGNELFKVTSIMETNEFSNKSDQISLSTGLVVNGEIIYEEKSWFQWMLGKLNIN